MKELQAGWLGRREYREMVALQEELVRLRRAGEIPDTLLLLEHEAVVTVGRTHPASLRSAPLPTGEGYGTLPATASGTATTGREDALPLPRGEGSLRSSGGRSPFPIVEPSIGPPPATVSAVPTTGREDALPLPRGEGSARSAGGRLPFPVVEPSNGPPPATASAVPTTGRESALPLPRGEGSARSAGGGSPFPIVETSRGGQATYHGPGQLVAYPILDLRQWRRDLHWYLRQLEAAGIATLRDLGLQAGNRAGHTGVWIGERKVASIGVAVRGWVTYHGLALNVDCDLDGFRGFSPCGLPPETMTSLRDLGLDDTVTDVAAAFAKAFSGVFGYDRLCRLPETPEVLLRLRAVATTIDGR